MVENVQLIIRQPASQWMECRWRVLRNEIAPILTDHIRGGIGDFVVDEMPARVRFVLVTTILDLDYFVCLCYSYDVYSLEH